MKEPQRAWGFMGRKERTAETQRSAKGAEFFVSEDQDFLAENTRREYGD
jgi:hypothetical protein